MLARPKPKRRRPAPWAAARPPSRLLPPAPGRKGIPTGPRSILCANESASEIRAAESSKGNDDRKMDPPWTKIRIRLPLRKRMSNDLLRLSNEVPHDTNNTPSKTVLEQTINMPCENLAITAVQGEASSSSPRKGLCNESNSNILSETLPDGANSDASTDKLPEEANDSNLNKSLLATSVALENYVSISSSKKTCEEANNNILIKALLIPSKELPQNSVDNIPSKNLIATGVLGEEENYNSPRKRLLYETNFYIPCKIIVPEEAKNNRKTNLAITAVQGAASSSSPRKGLCNESNSNILSETLPDEANSDTSTDKLPEEANDSNLHKNMLATSVARENYASISSAKKTCEEANNNILSKALLIPTKELPQNSVDNIPRKKTCEEANNNILSKALLIPTKELPQSSVDDIPSKNLITTGVLGEEKNYNSPRKRLLYETHCTIACKLVVPEEAKNKRKRNLATTAVNCEEANNDPLSKRLVVEARKRNLATTAVKCEEENNDTLSKRLVVEDKNDIPTTKVSGKAESNAPSNRTVDPEKKNIPRKKLRTAIATSEKTSQMKLSTSVGQSAQQRANAANLRAIQEYKEFEEKVKRTVYLDYFSHKSTEAVITTALNQFGAVRKVGFLVNYTIPYNIPQSALVEMESEKDAESVVNMLHEFPFMMSGMPRPVRAKRATAEMFNDRPRRPESKIEFRWVAPKDCDYEIVKKMKLLSKRHELENLALIKHELEEEQFLAKDQEENLNCQYMKLETVDSVVRTSRLDHLLRIFSMNMNGVF